MYKERQHQPVHKASVSYSACVQGTSTSAGTPEFRQIMRETKNEELVQQQEREVRAKNIIIHGCPEAVVIQEVKEDDNTM